MEPQQTPLPTSPIPKPKRRANWPAIVLGLASLILIGLLVWCWFYYPHPAPGGSGGGGSAAATGPCTDGAANTAPEGFVFYENAELKFKFAYPSAWGDVTVATTPMGGVSGHYLLGSFADNPNVSFGGNGTDYVVAARGGTLTDNPGYLEATNKFYSVQLWRLGEEGSAESEPKYAIYPIEDEVTQKQGCNVKAIVTQHPLEEFFGYAYDLARVNLQSDNLYYGVNFVVKNPDAAARADLDKLLGSFELID